MFASPFKYFQAETFCQERAPTTPAPTPSGNRQIVASSPAADGTGAGGGYKVSPDEMQLIMGAESSIDVPVRLRNKLYAALNRALLKPNVSDHVLARWSEDQNSSTNKFVFLQEWCKDTTFGQVIISESHIKKSEKVKEMTLGYYTQLDLEMKYKLATNPSAAAFIQKIIKTSKSIAHPLFPKDKSMRMFQVLDNFTENRKDSELHTKEALMCGTVAGPTAAKAVEDAFAKPVLSDAACFSAFDSVPALGEQPKSPKAKAKAKGKAGPVKQVDPGEAIDDASKSASKVTKLSVCVARLSALENDMHVLRKKLEQKKPAMKTLLDAHMGNVEILKAKLEDALILDEDDVVALKEYSEKTAALVADKTLKSDIATARSLVK